jgi:uncharacterized protein (DUF3084 family)
MLNTAQRRKWAALLRERYTKNAEHYRDEDIAHAIAQADLIDAQADLEDALAGCDPKIAESCAMVEKYPVFGYITREGGVRTAIERPWNQADIDRIESAGIMMCMEFSDDPRSGLEQGKLIRIYIGTRTAGPVAQWDSARNEWHRLHSNGNYGKKWAYGGTWSADKIGCKTLAECCPEIAKIIT